MAFAEIGVELAFEGEGADEFARVVACNMPEYQVPLGQVVCRVDKAYFRPTEVELLIGDPTKCKEKLGWEPKYDLPALVQDMMQADLDLFKRDAYLLKGGHKVLWKHEQHQ